jgi:transposase InsO family protein
MAYTQNPHMPRVRQQAADMVRRGHTPTETGRRFGVGSSTICKWVKKAEKCGHVLIPTLSSRPKHHPRELSNDLVWKIFHQRIKTKRCAEVIHQELKNQDIVVSLSSVKRTLDRMGLLKKRSPWKRFHPHVDRPYVLKAGDLIEIDTIHLMTGEKTRIYVFVLIDVFSRWVYAKCYEKMNSKMMLDFVREAQREAYFPFLMLQSDHGPEFGRWFVSQIKKNHRYTRIGKPNDNSHIERFNRTVQEECLDKVKREVPLINEALLKYLKYYNTERLHMGISFRSPIQLLNCVQAID